MPVYKYRVFDTFNAQYWSTMYGLSVWYSLDIVASVLDELKKRTVYESQYEIHRIKIGEMQTIE